MVWCATLCSDLGALYVAGRNFDKKSSNLENNNNNNKNTSKFSSSLNMIVGFVCIKFECLLAYWKSGKPSWKQWRSQSAVNARAQHGHITFASSLVLRPCPAFSRLQYRNAEAFWGILPSENFGIFDLLRLILGLL